MPDQFEFEDMGDYEGLMASALKYASNAPGIEKFAPQIEELMKEMNKGTSYPLWMQIAMPKIVARLESAKRADIAGKVSALGMGLKFHQMQQKETSVGQFVEKQETFEERPAPLPGEGKGMFPIGAKIQEKVGEREIPSLETPPTISKSIIDIIKAREKPKRETKEAGGRLFEIPEKGQAIPLTPEKEERTTERKNYEFDMKQRKDSGLPTINFNEWVQEQKDIKEKEKNASIHYETDDSGNVTKIVSDAITGKTVATYPMGKIGKKKAEPKSEADILNRALATQTIKEIPKLKAEADTQKTTLEIIDKSLALTKKGVTGKGGQLKAIIAPYAEMAGIETENLSNSQAFQLLTRVIVGPMRLDIVGTGPVSDYENKLMSRVSGGGGASRAAAIELLNHWRRRAINKINAYNSTLEGITTILPETGKIYKQIEMDKKEIPKGKKIIGTGTEKGTGKRVIKFDDGSIEYAK